MVTLRGTVALAVLAAAVALLACQGDDSEPAGMGAESSLTATTAPTATAAAPSPAARPTATATPRPSPTPSAQPSPSPTPEPPAAADSSRVEVSPNTVRQGEVFTVSLQNGEPASNANTSFAGLHYPMLWTGDIWWAVIGVAADFMAGQHQVQVIEDGLMNLPIVVLTVVEAVFPEELIQLEPEQAQLLTDPVAVEEERQLLTSTYAVVTRARLWSGPFILPAAGPLGDTFGMRRSFDGGPYSHHTGLDILTGEGAPVMAANSGRVALAADLHLRGGSVIIDHGAGVFSGYHHLSQVLVTEGERVAQGDVIGASGGTGLVTAAHLHWEVIVHGVRVDPLPWTEAEIGPGLSLQVAELVEDEGSSDDGGGLGAEDAPAEGDGVHSQSAGEPDLVEGEATLGADEQTDDRERQLLHRQKIAEASVPLTLPGEDAEPSSRRAALLERQGQ
ncbi:MAG: M23 family metallopeptidase [Dehalococcoidia bacterium]|nr:MAG: M23 family metallopeptidase [Dehalococcoidia bacterium]